MTSSKDKIISMRVLYSTWLTIKKERGKDKFPYNQLSLTDYLEIMVNGR